MRDALARLPLPVAIVGAASGGERSCSTGTLTYVSFEPPPVATPLAAASRTCRLLRESGEFSLSLLAAGQAELAVRAAAPSDGDKFAEQSIPVLAAPAGAAAPAVDGAATVLWCALESVTEAGRYLLCVGRVTAAATGAGEPLLRFERRYRALGADVPVAEEAPYPL
jgi:flavin reductase (DIM6/NTAB) family NADH-FMN oxidoreductase RutF